MYFRLFSVDVLRAVGLKATSRRRGAGLRTDGPLHMARAEPPNASGAASPERESSFPGRQIRSAYGHPG